MLKNPFKLTKSFSAQYYNIAQQFTFMYVRTHVHMYICMYVRTYVCMYVWTYVLYMYVSMYVRTYVCIVSFLMIKWG